MATRVSSRRQWLVRDMPRTYVVFVWVAFSFSLIFFFSDYWAPARPGTAVPPQASGPAGGDKNDSARFYTGSVIIVPARGYQCLELEFDNRTGNLRDKGHIDCDEVASKGRENSPGATGAMRMHAIGEAFRHESH